MTVKYNIMFLDKKKPLIKILIRYSTSFHFQCYLKFKVKSKVKLIQIYFDKKVYSQA